MHTFILTYINSLSHSEPQFISTEVSTSKERQFPMITFVDTPGLVDGDMQYTFDIERTLEWLGM